MKHEDHQLGILIVGTLPPPVCGTTVSLRHLVEQCRGDPEIRLRVLDTGGIRGQGLGALWRFPRTVIRLLYDTALVDVVTLHLSPLAIPILGPVALIACRLFHKRLVIRLFGGEDFSEFPGFRQRLFLFAARGADLYLAQTHRLLRSAQRAGIERARWYPTSRPMTECLASERQRCRKLAFLGLVKPSKGVPLLLEIADRLPPNVEIDVYGPFYDGMSEADFAGREPVRYRGIIAPGAAIQVLRDYDAVVLPTHWTGEGYPGVIIEAYHAGIPVIATKWRDIPEIVDESCGILVEPRSAPDLIHAIRRISNDESFYQSLQRGAREKADLFRAEKWAAELKNWCQHLTLCSNP